MSPDPAEATAHFDRERIAAVVEVSEPDSPVRLTELRLTPEGRQALEVRPLFEQAVDYHARPTLAEVVLWIGLGGAAGLQLLIWAVLALIVWGRT